MPYAVNEEKKAEVYRSYGEERPFSLLSSKRYKERNDKKGINRYGDDEHSVGIDLDKNNHKGNRKIGSQDAPSILQPDFDQGEVFSKGNEAEQRQNPNSYLEGDGLGYSEYQGKCPQVIDVGIVGNTDFECPFE